MDEIENLLRDERPMASPLELDRMKLRALQGTQKRRSRPGRLKGAVLKSRLALMSMIVVGILMSGTGATVAVTGIAGDGSSGTAQYGQDVAGETDDGGEGGGGDVLGDSEDGNTGDAAVQGTAQEAADGSERLPFTGFVAIPLLLGGVALLGTGVVLRRRLD